MATPPDPSPAEAILAAVEDHGPISFAEYMELALYGPGGFYERPAVGTSGHFLTSPHVHPVFGQLLAAALRELWEHLGRPAPFRLVEVGAGDGTLAAGLLPALAGLPVAYTAVERSPGSRAALRDRGLQVVGDLGALGPLDGSCVLANELLDNLPFRVVRRRGDTLVELRVGRRGRSLCPVEVPAEPALAALAPRLEAGEEAAIPWEALAFVDQLARTLTRGYALLIDYGEATGGSPGRVHGYRGHRMVEDVLQGPGGADITAGVDFAAVLHRAEAGGLRPLGLVSQREALLALGFGAWARGELDRQRRLLDGGAGLEAVRAWGGRSRATLLVDAAGLGRLRWLLVATHGLPAPPWLRVARGGRLPAD